MSKRIPQALVAAAVAIGAVIVVPAMAQDVPETRIESSAKATPSKAGTPQDPRGTAISAKARLLVAGDVEAPVVTGIDILVGPGLVWSGARYAKCTKATLDRRGPSGCPPTSIIGTATATGQADTAAARVDVVFVNGGRETKFAYATLNNPARIRETIPIDSQTMSGGEWSHRESLAIPRSLQIVAGIPLQLTDVTMKVGGKSYAKKFISSTSCPSGGWKYQVTAHYRYESLGGQIGSDTSTGTIACTD